MVNISVSQSTVAVSLSSYKALPPNPGDKKVVSGELISVWIRYFPLSALRKSDRVRVSPDEYIKQKVNATDT